MAESELRRTHPATVIVRSATLLWQSALGIFFVFIASGIGQSASIALFGGLIVLSVLIGVATQWVAWSRFGYGIQGEDLVVVGGLLVRHRSVIPVARVHGVNVRADLFMRMLGLVEVVVQTAGGGSNEPEAKIGAITLAEAEALKAALLHTGHEQAPVPAEEPGADAAGGAAGAVAMGAPMGADPVGRMSDFRGAFGGAEVHAAPVEYEHRVPFIELVIASLTSNRVPLMFALILGAGAQLVEVIGLSRVESAAGAAASLAVPVVVVTVVAGIGLVVLIALGAGIVRDFGFVARRSGQRIEIEAGLLERRLTGIPVRRVQSVRVEEPLLRKLLGRCTVYVDTAGISHQQQQASGGSTALLPGLRTRELADVMHNLLPEADEFPVAPGLPPRAVRFYLFIPTALSLLVGAALTAALGMLWTPGYAAGGTVVVLVALIVASVRALAWRAAGIGVDESAMTMQVGVFGRSRIRIARMRIQSLTITQNPFQRRAGLATIVADSVSGNSRARHRIAHLEAERAQRLLRWYGSRPVRIAEENAG